MILFYNWLHKNFPDRAHKVWHGIESAHDGTVNDSQYGCRLQGVGSIANMMTDLYRKYTKKCRLSQEWLGVDTSQFRRPGEQMKLF